MIPPDNTTEGMSKALGSVGCPCAGAPSVDRAKGKHERRLRAADDVLQETSAENTPKFIPAPVNAGPEAVHG